MVASQPNFVAPILGNSQAPVLAQFILDVDESGGPILEEGARRPAVARDLETLLHGHFVACGPDTGLIVLTKSRERERR